MTERKPPGVSWESWFEEQMRQAQEAGAFDPDWWVKKLVRVLALNAEIAKVNDRERPRPGEP